MFHSLITNGIFDLAGWCVGGGGLIVGLLAYREVRAIKRDLGLHETAPREALENHELVAQQRMAAEYRARPSLRAATGGRR